MKLPAFLLKTAVPALVWYLYSESIMKQLPHLSRWATNCVGFIADLLAKAVNLNTHYVPITWASNGLFYGKVFHEGYYAVFIADACNGIAPIGMMLIFLLAFAKGYLTKLFLGLAMAASIFVLNGIRVLLLALNVVYSPATFEFNHKYLWQLIVYSVIISFWVVIIKYFSFRYEKK
jgi:exosortase/archaeosortase family protein